VVANARCPYAIHARPASLYRGSRTETRTCPPKSPASCSPYLPQLTELASHIKGSRVDSEVEGYAIVLQKALDEKGYRLLPVSDSAHPEDTWVLLIVHGQSTDELVGGKYRRLAETGIGPPGREWVTTNSGGRVDGSTLRWHTSVVELPVAQW